MKKQKQPTPNSEKSAERAQRLERICKEIDSLGAERNDGASLQIRRQAESDLEAIAAHLFPALSGSIGQSLAAWLDKRLMIPPIEVCPESGRREFRDLAFLWKRVFYLLKILASERDSIERRMKRGLKRDRAAAVVEFRDRTAFWACEELAEIYTRMRQEMDARKSKKSDNPLMNYASMMQGEKLEKGQRNYFKEWVEFFAGTGFAKGDVELFVERALRMSGVYYSGDDTSGGIIGREMDFDENPARIRPGKISSEELENELSIKFLRYKGGKVRLVGKLRDAMEELWEGEDWGKHRPAKMSARETAHRRKIHEIMIANHERRPRLKN